MIDKIREDRQLRALTGLGFAEFERLLPVFSAVYEAERQKRYDQAVQAGKRRRKPGGGRKSKLPTMADKLVFVLYYYKLYPTFDQLGTQFDLVGDPLGAKAHERLYELSPLLHETLVQLEMMPKRVFRMSMNCYKRWTVSTKLSLMRQNGPIADRRRPSASPSHEYQLEIGQGGIPAIKDDTLGGKAALLYLVEQCVKMVILAEAIVGFVINPVIDRNVALAIRPQDSNEVDALDDGPMLA